VWINTSHGITFPHLYLFLVAHPGVGKQAIDLVVGMWREVKKHDRMTAALHLSPDNMSKAALIDAIVDARTTFTPLKGKAIEYHSLLVVGEEAGVLFPSYDPDFIGVLNKLYNAPDHHSERRRYGKQQDAQMVKPQLNLLVGATPGWLAGTLPADAWSTGLTARIIMLYSEEVEKRSLLAEVKRNDALRADLIERLTDASKLYGEVPFTQEALEHLDSWQMADGPPTPTHSKLNHYIRRRLQNALKLCLISAISRGEMEIEKSDVERAIGWLIEAEKFMPDIFRAMVGKSDSEVLEELHYFTVNAWRVQRKPLREALLIEFLSQRVPTEKINNILTTAERSSMIVRQNDAMGNTVYLPKVRGVE
jgi:hypothetical protein